VLGNTLNHSQTKMPALRIVVLLTAIAALCVAQGYVEGYFEFRHQHEPRWWWHLYVIVATALIYAWYYYDSEVRGFHRTKWLNIAVVGLAVVAIPYYVFQSNKGHRRKAILYLSGYVFLISVCIAIGEYLAKQWTSF
jgi:CDP-diglyceride synthetase